LKNKCKYSYLWHLKDIEFKKDRGKVFSCFAGGGGSTMGYKLAGFDVIGFNEVDPKMAECYIKNNSPKYKFIEPIQKFKNRNNLPSELFDLDILDGSPPCTSFSFAGNREKDWGKEKKYGEGNYKQVIDTLFFDFIDLAKKLRPKIVVAENVSGLLLGNARKYVQKILKEFDKANYFVDFKLLNSAKMGVPQIRKRVFFYAIRKDLCKNIELTGFFIKKPVLNLNFNFKEILFKEIMDEKGIKKNTEYQKLILKYFKYGDKKISDINLRVYNKNIGFTASIIYDNDIMSTILAKEDKFRASDLLYCTKNECIKASSFPLDYNFCSKNVWYVCGMSVPPVMIANIADRIYEQRLKNI
jgi:DNA (cytosine-5)-methyltransferase 1